MMILSRINQANLQEGEQQVNIMREVYSNTARNLVWLGPKSRKQCSRRRGHGCNLA